MTSGIQRVCNCFFFTQGCFGFINTKINKKSNGELCVRKKSVQMIAFLLLHFEA